MLIDVWARSLGRDRELFRCLSFIGRAALQTCSYPKGLATGDVEFGDPCCFS